MKVEEDKKKVIKQTISGLLLKIPFMLGMFYGCQYFDLPLGLTVGALMVLFLAISILVEYKRYKLFQKVLFIGLLVSSTIITCLFAYDHFIENIRISQLHVAVLFFPPLLVGVYLKKKEEDST